MNITWSETPPINPLPGTEWIDSHVHFDIFDRAGELERVIDRARAAGVNQMIAIGGSDEANERVVRISSAFSRVVYGVVGFDRDKAGHPNDLNAVRDMIRENPGRVVGIGESGLDYHYEPETAPQQRALFASMLELAAESALPVVVHSREADADTLDLLRAYVRNWPADPGRPGVLHCFTGNYEFAKKLIDLGMMISFSGIATFRNADDLRACAGKLPLDRLLIETDAPYLAPVPHRGKTNEPGWVVNVAEMLASTRGDTLQTLSEQTTVNTRFLFDIAKEKAS